MGKKIHPRPWKDQIETARKSEALKMVIPTTKEDLAWEAAFALAFPVGKIGYKALKKAYQAATRAGGVLDKARKVN